MQELSFPEVLHQQPGSASCCTPAKALQLSTGLGLQHNCTSLKALKTHHLLGKSAAETMQNQGSWQVILVGLILVWGFFLLLVFIFVGGGFKKAD